MKKAVRDNRRHLKPAEPKEIRELVQRAEKRVREFFQNPTMRARVWRSPRKSG